LAGLWGLLQTFYHRARFLQRQGFRPEDVREGFRVIAEEAAAVRQQLRNSDRDMMRHRQRMRAASVTGVLGVAMALFTFRFLRTLDPVTGRHDIPSLGLLTVVAAAIMISLALVSFLTDPVREPLLERLTSWLARGRLGQFLFRLAGRGLTLPGTSTPTGEADAGDAVTIASSLFSLLPTPIRRRLAATRRQVVALEQEATELSRQERVLEGALMEAGTTLAGVVDPLADRRAAVLSEMETARAAALDRRAEILTCLEGVRLELVRLRSGLGSPEEVEAELA
jgi:hypothetical protein